MSGLGDTPTPDLTTLSELGQKLIITEPLPFLCHITASILSYLNFRGSITSIIPFAFLLALFFTSFASFKFSFSTVCAFHYFKLTFLHTKSNSNTHLYFHKSLNC